MLFFRGRDHTILASMTGRRNLTQTQLTSWRRARIETRDHDRPACYVPVCLKRKRNDRKAVWFTNATVYWSNFCNFVDSVDSQTILRMSRES